MLHHNWPMWPALIWLLSCFLLFVGIDAQSQNAAGAHRLFQKTSFSCTGRPAGYYADVETGCQVYHMCDGLGRQFSYTCPNTTLFQQRMLICDHWYMVNCSRAESNYAANLLIGQRDKPFVNDEENSLRTPRPDLLDRPYAPDYSGESFRNQYKQFPAIQNQIQDTDEHKNHQKFDISAQLAPGPQRWKIPPPSRTIQPPAHETQQSAEVTPSSGNNVRFVPQTTPQPTSTSAGTNRASSQQDGSTAPTPPPINSRRPLSNRFNNAALHQRRQQEPLRGQSPERHDDLGTSHSTRYNTSADFNSAESPVREQPTSFIQSKNNQNTFALQTSTVATIVTSTSPTTAAISSGSTKGTPIKLPSKVYEPPFLYPIYNENDTFTTETPLRVSSATPFTSSPVTRTTLTTTPIPPPNRPTTLAGKPFSAPNSASPTTPPSVVSNFGRSQNDLIQPSHNQQRSKEARTPTPAQGFKPPTPLPPVSPTKSPATANNTMLEASPFDFKIPTTSRLPLPTSFINSTTTINRNSISLPSKELLPPFQEFVEHDIATTQGPPIYYEWKIPSNGLEPPKLDPPIGVDGREYPDAVVDYNSISGSNTEPKNSVNSNANNNNKSPTTRTPTLRSIKETGQPKSVFHINVGKPSKTSPNSAAAVEATPDATPAASSDITQLRKEYSVPDYAFPLELIGRTGYLSTDTYNSFQLKIPEHRNDEAEEHLHWFGENPQCPECHPSFVVPGTCDPCLRR